MIPTPGNGWFQSPDNVKNFRLHKTLSSISTPVTQLSRRSHDAGVKIGLSLFAVAFFLVGCLSFQANEAGLRAVGIDQAGEPNANPDLIARARAARANGELEVAVRLLRAALAVSTKDDRLRIELGEALTDAGDYDQAYDAINTALQGEDRAVRESGYVALGRLFFKLRRPSESAAFFDKALDVDPRNVRALIGRGVALDLTGRFEQAQASYLAALEVAPGDPRAQNNLALSHAFAGNFARAVEILYPMATAPHATKRLRQNLALVYGLMGNGELAASISRRDLDEETVQNNLRFYEILRRMPNPAEALAGAGG
ncbi:MAG: tetratricopeptide repeat protein [Alphaproteobacteria bacterium]|nr:tetratricopeptide repeat protein [Alphaproteobacteria bacterium]